VVAVHGHGSHDGTITPRTGGPRTRASEAAAAAE